MNLSKKVILVTGGGSGIGAAISRRFKAMGNQIIICGRNEARLGKAATSIGVYPIRCDVADPEECAAMLHEIGREFGRLDILINCAGIMLSYDFMSTDDAAPMIEDEIAINAVAPLRLTHQALALLKKSSEPMIVFVSSGLAYVAYFKTPVYSGSKALIHHAAQVLRHQLKDHGFKVYELLPPVTDTAMADGVESKRFKKASPAEVVDALLRGMERGQYEIPAGDSKKLRLLSRLAPGFLFNQMTKAFD